MPRSVPPISFSLLLNLVAAAHAPDKRVLWGFVEKDAGKVDEQARAELDRLMDYALAYYRDFVEPNKRYRAPDDLERQALEELLARLKALPEGTDAEDIQAVVYEVGKAYPFPNLRDWFRALYEVLLGESSGPRFGGFVALYGIGNTCRLIERALAGEDLGQ